MSPKPWALVTPASRGIGRSIARNVLQKSLLPVVATARRAEDVDATKRSILIGTDVKEDRLTVLPLDFLQEESFFRAAERVSSLIGEKGYLHLVFSLPGILHPERSPSQVSYNDALRTFQTNALGPLILAKHFGRFLPKKYTEVASTCDVGMPSMAVWVNMSARVGSISDNRIGGWYSYRSSKAALNQITKTFDLHLKTVAGDRAVAVAMHPGTVKTGLSEGFWGNVAEDKLFEPEFAAEKLMNVINRLKVEQRGRCWDWKGEEILP